MRTEILPLGNEHLLSNLSRSYIESARRTLEIDARGLHLMREAFNDGQLGASFADAVGLIERSQGRLIITGVGKSGLIGSKLAATFASTGTPAYFVHPTEATHGDLGMITEHDVIIALSWSGESQELAGVLAYANHFHLPVIAISSGADSTLARAATVALVLPKVEEACPLGLAPTTSAALQMIIGDALAVALLEARGFTAEKFRVFHPGGKLSAQLILVHDLMRRGDSVPLTRIGAPMQDAIATIDRCGVGIVGVLDSYQRLVGVITDGDILRNIHCNLVSLNVENIMNGAPKVIAPNEMAAEALKQMATQQVSTLFVVDSKRVVGFLHAQDMLEAGISRNH